MGTVEQYQAEYSQWQQKYGLVPANFTPDPSAKGHLEIYTTIVDGVAQFLVDLSVDVSRDGVAHAAGHVLRDMARLARDPFERGVSAYNIDNEVAAILTPGQPWWSGGMRMLQNVAPHEAFAEAFAKANTGDFGPMGYAVPTGQVDPFPQAALLAYFPTATTPRPDVQPQPAQPPAAQPAPQPAPAPAGTTLKGVDVSNWQGVTIGAQVDFQAIKASGTAFVLIKASEGLTFEDPDFARSWGAAYAAGLVRGAYHFAHPETNDPEAEADYFLTVVARNGGWKPGDLVALDWETRVDPAFDIAGWCLRFLERVREATTIKGFAYLNLSEVNGHDWSVLIQADYPLWLADYDGTTDPVATPWPVLAIKQYTSSAVEPGVQGRCDMDVFFGGLSQLAKYGLANPSFQVPVYVGQTAEQQTVKVGDVLLLEAEYEYGTTKVWVQRKVWSHKAGTYTYSVYPPVDPQADPTECLDAQPATYAITVVES